MCNVIKLAHFNIFSAKWDDAQHLHFIPVNVEIKDQKNEFLL